MMMIEKKSEPDSKSVCGDTVWVRVPPPAPRVSDLIAGRVFGPHQRFRSAILALLVAVMAPAHAADQSEYFVQMRAINGACSVPYKLQPGVDLHVHCYTTAIIQNPAATVETGSPSVSATIVQTFYKPAGAWVVLRGAANGTGRIVLFDAAKYRSSTPDIHQSHAK